MISIVIPAYNEELFLPQLLRSLTSQTYKKPYEIIVVDNASSDKTARIARSFGARVVSESKRGYAHACNKGFSEAKGEIIARADADYMLPADWLEKIDRIFAKQPTTIAIGGPLYPLESHWWESIIYYPFSLLWMYTLKLLGRGFLFPNMAVRAGAYKKSGGFNTTLSFGEDTDMCYRLKKQGSVKLVPSMYVYTSMRKFRALGFFNMVFRYSIEAQVRIWQGKPVHIGLEAVRTVPKQTPKPQKPWLFLLGSPLFLALVLLLVLVEFPTPAAANMNKYKKYLHQKMKVFSPIKEQIKDLFYLQDNGATTVSHTSLPDVESK